MKMLMMLSMQQTANVRFELRISQNRKLAVKNSSENSYGFLA